jgi:hypothetical protein
MSEIPKDGSDLPFLSRRHHAAHEIAEVERERSLAHETALGNTTETLGRFDMHGEWDAADEFEGTLFATMAALEDDYNMMRIYKRRDPRAKIVVTIPAGLTSEHGYVALQRKRLFMRLTSSSVALPPLEIDKISMFALDIQHLAGLSEVAVREVRLIVAGAMYLAIDQHALGRNDFGISDEHRELFEKKSAARGQTEEAFLRALEYHKMLHEALIRYDMTSEEVLARLASKEPTRLHHADSLQFIEDALHTRSELLTPAATTYYAHS